MNYPMFVLLLYVFGLLVPYTFSGLRMLAQRKAVASSQRAVLRPKLYRWYLVSMIFEAQLFLLVAMVATGPDGIPADIERMLISFLSGSLAYYAVGAVVRFYSSQSIRLVLCNQQR